MRTIHAIVPLALCAALLQGCAGAGGSKQLPAVPAPPALAQPDSTFASIYSFLSGRDGAAPEGDIATINGVIYGATNTGNITGFGTIFRLTTAGQERAVYKFKGGTDGEYPSGVTEVNGALYGPTWQGGNTRCSGGGCGTIFKVSTAGAEQVLYRFKGGTDGANPGEVINLNGTFYGTTYHGGGSGVCSGGCGTIFSLTPSGTERVLHGFKGGADGATPWARMIAVNGSLYGTTLYGGNNGCEGYGCGLVFKISTSGKYQALYRFVGKTDGGEPSGVLLNVNGMLYGTTYVGGKCANSVGCGTVFKITTSGDEHPMYSFKGTDGSNPTQGLVAFNGMLYGTAQHGGSCPLSYGCGTLFQISTAGAEKLLHKFTGADGATPTGGRMRALNGKLYGTTMAGGSKNAGTVFAYKP